jgi:hypothetical protein
MYLTDEFKALKKVNNFFPSSERKAKKKKKGKKRKKKRNKVRKTYLEDGHLV